MEFQKAIEIILKMEGGYSFDARDPGGETHYGISKRQYPKIDIKNLSVGHAKMIYERDYWNASKCHLLPPGIRLMVFDCAVNQGLYIASIFLQNVVGAKPDGVIGAKTMRKVEEKKNSIGVSIMNLDYAKLRLIRYSRTNNFNIYGSGWINRVFEIIKASEEALIFI